jgi:glutaredoxin-related protein
MAVIIGLSLSEKNQLRVQLESVLSLKLSGRSPYCGSPGEGPQISRYQNNEHEIINITRDEDISNGISLFARSNETTPQYSGSHHLATLENTFLVHPSSITVFSLTNLYPPIFGNITAQTSQYSAPPTKIAIPTTQ